MKTTLIVKKSHSKSRCPLFSRFTKKIRSTQSNIAPTKRTLRSFIKVFRSFSKDCVSRKIARPFVKCKIRNASPQKWNKPRHTGWWCVGGSLVMVAGSGWGQTRVRLCVSFISTDIIMALCGRS